VAFLNFYFAEVIIVGGINFRWHDDEHLNRISNEDEEKGVE
jgi:hypothetical protein